MNYNDNVIKVLNILNLKPYEFFKIPEITCVYYFTFTNDLTILKITYDGVEMFGGPGKLLINLLLDRFKYYKLTSDEFKKLKEGIKMYHSLLINDIYFEEELNNE